RLPLDRPQRRIVKSRSKRIGAFGAEERVHMLLDDVIGQAGIDAGVVEEKAAIAAPILEYRIDQPERHALVAPRVHEEQSGDELILLEFFDDLVSDLA